MAYSYLSYSAVIKQASALLKQGGLVAFPTETVYGLGADATHPDAVQRIFDVKKRPTTHPLIVHLATLSQLSTWAVELTPSVWEVARVFWPGALTLILKKAPTVLTCVTGGQETIGIRIPRHPLAQALLQDFGGGIAAPSANQFTHLSATTAEAVQEELGESVDLIVDGGPCEEGIESTILAMHDKQPVILRPGLITAAQIEKVLHQPVPCMTSSTVRVPGMHAMHYAPRTRTVLIASDQLPHALHTIASHDLPVAVLCYSILSERKNGIEIVALPADPLYYARELYHQLRLLDHRAFKTIIVEAVPQTASWDAIRDRLTRACETFSYL